MSKRILVILLALCLAITAMTVAIMAGTYGSESEGWILDSGVLTVYSDSGMNGWSNNRDVVMSEMTTLILKDGVTNIPENTFIKCGQLLSVTLPSTLTSIGKDAFNSCDSLTSITIPSSVTSIGENAFSGCTSLASAVLDCSTTYYSTSFPSTTTITLTHTYVNGVCSVCQNELDYVTLGSLKLHDGYYTTDGSAETAGTPDSSVTSYAYYADGTLTLCGYEATSTISYDGDLEIVLTDENSVTVTNGDGISATGNLTISGTGSLDVTTDSNKDKNVYAIASTGGSVTISETTVTANAADTIYMSSTYAIYAYSGVTIIGSTLNVKASSGNDTSYAIYPCGDIKITKSSKVTAETTGTQIAEGLYSMKNIVIEEGSKISVIAKPATDNIGYARALYAYGNITITDSAIENAEATGYSHVAIVCRGSNGITLTNSEAVIVGGIVVDGSFTVTPTTGSVLEVQIGTTTTYCKSATKIDSTTATVTIKAHTHTYDTGEVTTEPTCTKTGVMTYTCTVCGDSYTEAIKATGHSYTVTACDWSSDYTSATLTLTCDSCGETQTVDTKDIESEVTAVAQCDDEGAALYTATGTYNGVEYTYSVTVASSATGHTFGTPEIVWASESKATASVTCSNCGAIEPLEVTVTSTTDSNGNTIYTATVTYNGQTYTSEQTVEAVKTTTSKSDVFTTLSRIQASYTGVQAAIAKANALNPDDYENFSSVTEAIEAVDWSLSTLNQAQVNSYAEAIEEAIENLIPAETVDIEEETIEVVDPVEVGDTDVE